MNIVRYRAVRLSCRITMTEIARAVGITPQRMSQFETPFVNHMPENPERLILALEDAITRQKTTCEKALSICMNMRGQMFKHISESEAEGL